MTFAELRYLVALAQDRHFGRASERCCVSQPALSLAIRKLEDELGTTVFERRKHHITLTVLGEWIVHQAQRVLDEADQIRVIAAQEKTNWAARSALEPLRPSGPISCRILFLS